MFEVNLVKKPGIQDFKVNVEADIPDKTTANISFLKDSEKKHKTNYFSYIVILALLFICFIFFINFGKVTESYTSKNISISLLLQLISDEKDNMKIEAIDYSDRNGAIVAKFKFFDERKLYRKLELLNEFKLNAYASSGGYDNLIINVKGRQFFNDNITNSIKDIHDLILDFNGIESEMFNERIIVVCNYVNLVNLLKFFENQNSLSEFDFQISQINENFFYKLIISQIN